MLMHEEPEVGRDPTLDSLDRELDEVKALYRSGKKAEAAPLFESLAEAGSVPAMTWVGYIYLKGRGVDVDTSAALAWFLRAAEAGDGEAMGWIAHIHFYGDGVPVDMAAAYQWYTKAAEAGEADAMSRLGYMYSKGIEAPKDLDSARHWFSKAAQAGDASGQHNYASLLFEAGESEAAESWIRKAAEQEHAPSVRWVREQEAYRLTTSKRYAEALPILEKLGEDGSAWAHQWLGHIYLYGRAVAKNFDLTAIHYEAAYEGGRHELAVPAGIANFRASRPEAALEWLRKDAKAPISSLYWQYRVLASRPELERHPGEAEELLVKAADAGHVYARRAVALKMIKGNRKFGTRLEGLRMFGRVFSHVLRIHENDPNDERLH
ncbi:MAG: sel1 repeat family protein [Mesorhizobium sp.]|nr:MAG: sel1 repeat family protein [Mesorhizobium sp.]